MSHTHDHIEDEHAEIQQHRIEDEDALKFMLAGNATVTLRSKRTGTRFTFKITRCEDKPTLFFVALLNGPDNERNFQFLGSIFTDKSEPRFFHDKKQRISPDAPSAKAFKWAFEKLRFGFGHDQLEVWHEGRCGRCGRKLTVPESIASGFGPECIGLVS